MSISSNFKDKMSLNHPSVNHRRALLLALRIFYTLQGTHHLEIETNSYCFSSKIIILIFLSFDMLIS